MRLRIRRTTWPRPALILTDTPRPRCPDCRGRGGWTHHYITPDGEYGGPNWFECPCWDADRRWTLLPLPRPRGEQYSDEPPF